MENRSDLRRFLKVSRLGA